MLTLLLLACAGHQPPLPAELAPPPSSPNCVHSQATDETHAIEPLALAGADPDAAWKDLHEVVIAMPRVELVNEQTDYRQYVFTTALWGFKDDVQFVLARDEGVIHFRSASRVGKSDLGVNRKRMETIREAFTSR